jgi:integrase
MAILNLTRANIAALPAVEGLWWDDRLPRFGYRQRKPDADGKCHASFLIGYRFGNEQKKYKLGDASAINADQARKLALVALGKIAAGIDPQAEKEAARVEAAKVTVAQAVEQYLAVKAGEVRPASLRTMRLYLTGSTYFQNLHRKPIDSVTGADIQPRLDRISNEVSAASAGQARAALNGFFMWSLRRGLCNENPVLKTEEPKAEAESTRALSSDELRQVWTACHDSDYGRIVRLLILTGCRREEIGGLRWSEFNDLDAGIVTIPGERTKNHKPLTLPLPAMAMEIIRSIPQRDGIDHLFGAQGGGFKTWGYSKTALLAVTGAMEPWRLHDLRHTLSTGMHEIGIEPHVVEAVVNHISGHKGGVAGKYNHAQYRAQMSQALIRWADHVRALVTGTSEKVVALRHAVNG